MKKETTSSLSSGASRNQFKARPVALRTPTPPVTPPEGPAAGPRKAPRANGGTNSGEANGRLDAEQILSALVGLKQGNFSARLPVGWTGIAGKVADAFNDVAEMMQLSTGELSRISRVVGKEGRI